MLSDTMASHNEKIYLLKSIAFTIKDYRAGEIAEPTHEHVNRWIEQFDDDVRIPLLTELNHVFNSTYFSKEKITLFFNRLVNSEKIAGTDPCAYWKKTNFLKIQQYGHSQEEMLKLFDDSLYEQCGFRIDSCGVPEGDYVYIDDIMFSGSRVGNDLSLWIEKHAPTNAKVHVIVTIMHSSGEYFVTKRLVQAVETSRKNIEISYWRSTTVENRKGYKNASEVLWPAVLPDNELVTKYLAQPQKYPFEPRIPDGKLGPFSSEEGRQLLESELLIAGLKIRALSQNPKDILRPLGFSPFGLGFGSMFVTFRNCPNNCPLALWWGDPSATYGPFLWYPLFRRKTYEQSQGG